MEFEVLAGLNEDQRRLVLAGCFTRKYGRGAIVVREGDIGDELFFLEAGRVALKVATPAGDEATLAVLRPGQAFGEMALVGERRRTASVVALEPVVARAMSRGAFDHLRRDHPIVDRLLVDILAARVDRLSQHLTEALYLPVETRLARRLLALCEIYRGGPGPVALPLTQQDIAGLVGTSRPTTNLILNRLAEEGVVGLSRGVVWVHSEAALNRLAAG